jgi:enoyl-[acyl-carrier-protein] reductase (NADH)
MNVPCNKVWFSAYGQQHILFTTKSEEQVKEKLEELCSTAVMMSFETTEVNELEYINNSFDKVEKHLDKIRSYDSI